VGQITGPPVCHLAPATQIIEMFIVLCPRGGGGREGPPKQPKLSDQTQTLVCYNVSLKRKESNLVLLPVMLI
jgi:hypothetical protein